MGPSDFRQLARYRRILLLQGPNGPFFARLRDFLEDEGRQVWKVNFNGGDDLFYRNGRITRFAGQMTSWRSFLRDLLISQRIDAIVVFGDCRRPHRMASQVAQELGIAFWVFEEGYVRPGYVTLELGGVNANSPIAPLSLADMPAVKPQPRYRSFRHGFALMAWYSFWYFAGGMLGCNRYRHYRHHKPFGFRELGCWVRAGIRKPLYRWQQRKSVAGLLAKHRPAFFIVALQVHNDSQILTHSPWQRIEAFIESTLFSFARHAPADCVLVIKHHPMDRGHTNYAAAIRACARRLDVSGRVVYLHDAHLPTLLQRCSGLVTINSTAGLQALFHGVPVIALGRCFYAKEGVSYQGCLDDFWRDARPADKKMVARLRNYVIHVSQVNSSFYADGAPGRAEMPARSLPGLWVRLYCGPGLRTPWLVDVVGQAVPIALQWAVMHLAA
ncbi:capsule biosynthesis protein [Cupriavidus sp. 30B13]|uniref:capsule biosynthesis protein n=1 Tax=Cupriavidus sp. 30B13 TaxID=3384241 RepID=UPI003B8FAD9D